MPVQYASMPVCDYASMHLCDTQILQFPLLTLVSHGSLPALIVGIWLHHREAVRVKI